MRREVHPREGGRQKLSSNVFNVFDIYVIYGSIFSFIVKILINNLAVCESTPVGKKNKELEGLPLRYFLHFSFNLGCELPHRIEI